MAKRLFTAQAQSFTAQATGATLTNATYMGIQGANTTQIIDILEIFMNGQASASAVSGMTFQPASTAPTTPTALATPNSDGPLNASATALASPAVTYVAAATGPQASALTTVPKVVVGANFFGGVVRWNAAPTQQITSVGNAVNLGTWLLFNSSTGSGTTGAAMTHIMYEPY